MKLPKELDFFFPSIHGRKWENNWMLDLLGEEGIPKYCTTKFLLEKKFNKDT
jgi:hypothetical protein